MSSSSKPALALLGLVALLTLLFAAGCMSDAPAETDMPWSAPAAWEGTMPMPGGVINRYD